MAGIGCDEDREPNPDDRSERCAQSDQPGDGGPGIPAGVEPEEPGDNALGHAGWGSALVVGRLQISRRGSPAMSAAAAVPSTIPRTGPIVSPDRPATKSMNAPAVQPA